MTYEGGRGLEPLQNSMTQMISEEYAYDDKIV
jgi:hypothetical protein